MLIRTVVILAVVLLTSPLASVADQLEPGLVVRFYQIGHGMNQMPDLVPGQLPNAVKTIPTLELRTDRGDFAPFEGNFYTEVEGFVTIKDAGTYTFRLISDDGSMLWIDDRLVVNHDGPHGAVPKDGEIKLTAGDHMLRVAHFESGGEEHLELQWRQPGVEADNFTLIPAAILRHDHFVSRETSPGDKRIIPPLRRGLPGDGSPVAGMHPSFKFRFCGTGRLQTRQWSFDGSQFEGLRLISTDAPSSAEGPVIWIPAGTFGKGPEIAPLRYAPYEGQYLVLDSPEAGRPPSLSPSAERLLRLTIDTPDNCRQGAFLRSSFIEGGIMGLGVDDKGDAWTAGLGATKTIGNHKLEITGRSTFEMLAIRAMTNGFEIEFTKPLDARCGWEPEAYYVEQWPFNLKSQISDLKSERAAQASAQPEREAQASAQPPRRDGVRYPVKSATVSADRKKVFLEIPDLKESHVVYIRLLPPCYSADGERPWSTEAWYTLNVIPKACYGEVLAPPEPEPQNILTAEEQAAGWKLLFDGKTTAGWRGYRKDHMPDGWQVKDGCLVRVGPGGDIITEDQWGDFELEIEWRICAAGNSGIFYRVNEDFDWPFFTGPEFQVLDNAEHADGRSPLTSAGSNYALHAPARDATAPVGFFNRARIVCKGPHVEHWLNGEKIVEYELWTDEWKQMVAGSKFAAWPNYGLMKKGHIVLQDHGDMVWYRNIKIRRLDGE